MYFNVYNFLFFLTYSFGKNIAVEKFVNNFLLTVDNILIS